MVEEVLFVHSGLLDSLRSDDSSVHKTSRITITSNSELDAYRMEEGDLYIPFRMKSKHSSFVKSSR